MTRIALAFLAGDDCFEQGVERMLDSAVGKIDETYCSFNGKDEYVFKTLTTLTWAAQFEWVDNFAAARNHSFQLVRDSLQDFDWIFWCDSDDVLPPDLDLRAIAERAVEKRAHGVMLPYYYAYDEEREQPLTVHYKERLFRADLPWRWFRPLHEQCISGATQIPLLDGSSHRIDELVGQEPWLYAFDLDRKAVVAAQARDIRKTATAQTIHVLTDGGELVCTPDHLVLMKDGSWRAAGDLKPDDSLMPLYRKRKNVSLTSSGTYEQVYQPWYNKWDWTHSIVDREINGYWTAKSSVHHIDENTHNNHPSNLVRLTQADHCRLHAPAALSAAQLSRIRWGKDGAKEKMSRAMVLENERRRQTGEMDEISKKIRDRFLVDYNPFLIVELHRQWQNGASFLALSKQTGIGRKVIKDRFKRAGLPLERSVNHRVISITPGEVIDVYDMTVDGPNSFAIGPGIFVHNCSGPVATRMLRVSDMGAVIHLRGGGEKRERNRRITARWWRQFKEGQHSDPRALVFMGNEVYAQAEVEEDQVTRTELAEQAISLFREYLDGYRDYSDPAVVEDDYATNLLVGRCLFLAGRPNDAINVYLQGVKLKPTWPAAYVSIAETYLAVSDYEKAVEWARLTITAAREVDSDHAPSDPLDANYKPLMVEGAALMELRKFEDAVDAYDKAMVIRADEHTQERWNQAFEAANNQHNSDEQTDNDVRRMREGRWGQRGTNERSICFWTAPSVEEWSADLIDEHGSGGTEYVVTRLAQHLARRGWRVVIFGTPPREGYDTHGVEFYHSYRWHPDEPFDVFVSVRAPQLLDAEINAECKVLWMHDVAVGDERFDDLGRDRFSRCEAIVCPSNWHGNHLIRVYDIDAEMSVHTLNVIPNGLDRDLFLPRHETIRDPLKFVYASSPDRGLVRLLDLWPQIRERHPESSLHVFYGWEFIDKIAQAGLPTAPQLLALKDRINQRVADLGGEEGGIHWHGRVNQTTLAEHFRGSDTTPAASVLTYPANFMETGFITGAQAMTAGVLPLVPDMGNLPDLVKDERLIVRGAAPDSEVFGPLFLDHLDALLELSDEDHRELVIRLQNYTTAFHWDFVVDHWESLFDRVLRDKTKAAA